MKNEKNWFKRHPVWTTILGLLVLSFVLSAFSGDDGTTTSVKETEEQEINPKSVNVGEKGNLFLEDFSTIPVCTTKENFNELIDAAVANDEIGYRNLLFSDKCFLASTLVESETRVLVIDITIGSSEFRFIDPESLHYGETAWTNAEYIIPSN